MNKFMEKKRIVFITGTRADYGKIKPLMKVLDQSSDFSVYVFVCGMHLSSTYGSTYKEIQKDGYENIYIAYSLSQTQNASVNLGNTITCISGYVENIKPDMILVHGDRVDALAGAVVGALHNILVGHVEGGELSGTIDESIRHAISKFAQIHFVCNNEARMRLIQLGEEENKIYVIGSPDIDVMKSKNLPSLIEVKQRYDIDFKEYGIMMYHPVTTEYATIGRQIHSVVDAVIKSGKNFIVVYPNNDLGSEIILNEYQRLLNNKHFRVFPSLRFEYFLVLLKNADFLIGNSSAGIRESGIYGIPAIDIGTRQNGRYDVTKSDNIQHVSENIDEILEAIANSTKFRTQCFLFGEGKSTEKFFEIVKKAKFWDTEIQKHFVDRDM